MRGGKSKRVSRSLWRATRSALLSVYRAGVRFDFAIFSRINELKVLEAGKGLEANHKTRLSKNTRLGADCSFNGLKVLGDGLVTIGNGFRSGPDCLIITASHNYEGTALPYDDSNIVKDVTVGNYVWLGARVIILPGASLGDGCIVQTGSVVVGDIPALAIVGGHPARQFGERSVEHWRSITSKDGSADG